MVCTNTSTLLLYCISVIKYRNYRIYDWFE